MKRQPVASLVVSASFLVALAASEGYSGKAYHLKGDVPTIGFGETKNVHIGQTTNPVRALIALNKDLDERKAVLARLIRVPLFQHEFDAYEDFAYNVGLEHFRTSTVLVKLNEQKYSEACHHILDWQNYNGHNEAYWLEHHDRERARIAHSLTERRDREYKQCMGGVK